MTGDTPWTFGRNTTVIHWFTYRLVDSFSIIECVEFNRISCSYTTWGRAEPWAGRAVKTLVCTHARTMVVIVCRSIGIDDPRRSLSVLFAVIPYSVYREGFCGPETIIRPPNRWDHQKRDIYCNVWHHYFRNCQHEWISVRSYLLLRLRESAWVNIRQIVLPASPTLFTEKDFVGLELATVRKQTVPRFARNHSHDNVIWSAHQKLIFELHAVESFPKSLTW
jgi:hypothetical protein